MPSRLVITLVLVGIVFILAMGLGSLAIVLDNRQKIETLVKEIKTLEANIDQLHLAFYDHKKVCKKEACKCKGSCCHCVTSSKVMGNEIILTPLPRKPLHKD